MELLTQLMKVPSAALCLFALFFLLVALLKIKGSLSNVGVPHN